MKTAIAIALLTLCTPLTGLAESAKPAEALHADVKHADAKPMLAVPGKLLFEDDFSRAELPPKWKVGKGTYAINDGVLSVAENPADNHGAYFKAPFAHKDIVADFSFKFDGAKNINFTMDDLSYKGSHAGHICHVAMTPTRVTLADTKNGGMKLEIYEKMQDPKTTPEEKKKLRESIKDFSAGFAIKLDPTAWHMMRVELVGDEMLAMIDGTPVGYLQAPGVAHETKALLGFTIGGKAALLDNVKVREGKASPDWAKQKAEVLAGLKK